jgi:hypothetical protein
MVKALKVALRFLVLWIIVSSFLFVYSDIGSVLWQSDVYPNVLTINSGWAIASASVTLPITSSGDPFAALEPVQVLQQYQKEHSAEALANHSAERKFVVAYYYGPDRAGNILHNFFNSIIWAVVTNRTILWEYYVDRPQANSVQDCDSFLKRNPWLPSYTEWSRKLHLPAPVPVTAREILSTSAQVVLPPQIRDIYPRNDTSARAKWSDHPAHLLQQQSWSLFGRNRNSAAVTERIRQLYSRGPIFLYGMLFQACFTITVNTTSSSSTSTSSLTSVTSQQKPTDISIALHSRHTVAADDGSHVKAEIACLQTLLPVDGKYARPCWVYLMSDRPKTLELLSVWLLARNCTPVVATRTPLARGSQAFNEHGPRAGSGFLEDLNMASAARTGFIGVELRQQGLPARSSTALVLEKIEYDRTIEAVANSRSLHPRLHELQRCALPFRDETKGYTYGPGTPTFHRNVTWIKLVNRERNERRRRERRPN